MLWRRWLGCWIDFLAVVLLIAIVAFALLLALPETVVYPLLSLVVLAYYPVTEAIWGRTAGKFLTGTIVVDAEGARPAVWRVLVRTLMRVIEVNPFLIGGFPAGVSFWLTKHKQRLGDLAAGTYVVPVRDLERARMASPAVGAIFD